MPEGAKAALLQGGAAHLPPGDPLYFFVKITMHYFLCSIYSFCVHYKIYVLEKKSEMPGFCFVVVALTRCLIPSNL